MILLHFALYRDSAFCTNVTLVHFDVCTISTHFASFFCTNENENVPIVTLVQNALYLGQRILHQCNNWYILIFLLHNALAMSTLYVTML